MQTQHDWKYETAADRFVCRQCLAATADSSTYVGECVKPVAQKEIDEFVMAMDHLIVAAMEVSDKWVYLEATTQADKEYGGAYPHYLPDFDEFIHDLISLKWEAKYDVRKGDCYNCIVGDFNPHHVAEDHADSGKDYASKCNRECAAQCLGYTPDSERNNYSGNATA